MKKLFRKTIDIICIVLDLIFTVISFPFKIVKAILDLGA